MTTIELGDVSTETPAPSPPVDVRRTARWVLVALTVAGLVVLGGSGRPPQATVRQVWSIPIEAADEIGYGGGTAYVSRAAGPAQAGVTAYTLADGRKRWTASVGVAGPVVPYPDGSDVLLLRADFATADRVVDGSEQSVYYSRTTVALDASTGAEIWRVAGDASQLHEGTVLIERHDPAGHTIRLDLVRVRDGGLIWSRPVPPDGDWAVVDPGGVPRAIVSADRRGTINEWRYSDGAAVRAVRLPGVVGSVSAAGELLVVAFTVSGDGYGRDTTRVYRADDLAPVWTLPPGDGTAIACGTVVCTPDPAGVAGRDPRTGTTRWQRPGLLAAFGFGNRVFLMNLVNEPAVQLVDSGTGQLVGPPVLGQLLWTHDPDARSLLVLRRSDGEPGGRVIVAEAELATGRTTVRGTIDDVTESGCADVRPFLACRRGDDLVVMAVG